MSAKLLHTTRSLIVECEHPPNIYSTNYLPTFTTFQPKQLLNRSLYVHDSIFIQFEFLPPVHMYLILSMTTALLDGCSMMLSCCCALTYTHDDLRPQFSNSQLFFPCKVPYLLQCIYVANKRRSEVCFGSLTAPANELLQKADKGASGLLNGRPEVPRFVGSASNNEPDIR